MSNNEILVLSILGIIFYLIIVFNIKNFLEQKAKDKAFFDNRDFFLESLLFPIYLFVKLIQITSIKKILLYPSQLIYNFYFYNYICKNFKIKKLPYIVKFEFIEKTPYLQSTYIFEKVGEKTIIYNKSSNVVSRELYSEREVLWYIQLTYNINNSTNNKSDFLKKLELELKNIQFSDMINNV